MNRRNFINRFICAAIAASTAGRMALQPELELPAVPRFKPVTIVKEGTIEWYLEQQAVILHKEIGQYLKPRPSNPLAESLTEDSGFILTN